MTRGLRTQMVIPRGSSDSESERRGMRQDSQENVYAFLCHLAILPGDNCSHGNQMEIRAEFDRVVLYHTTAPGVEKGSALTAYGWPEPAGSL